MGFFGIVLKFELLLTRPASFLLGEARVLNQT